MKKLSLLILILSLSLLMGCASRGEVKEMAHKQTAMLEELTPIVNEIINDYSRWESGEITREQLSAELNGQHKKITDIKTKFYEDKAELSRFAINSASFWKINYMSTMCYDIEQFLIGATQGYPESVVNSVDKPLPDSSLKTSFEENINRYFENADKLKRGIDEIIRFF